MVITTVAFGDPKQNFSTLEKMAQAIPRGSFQKLGLSSLELRTAFSSLTSTLTTLRTEGGSIRRTPRAGIEVRSRHGMEGDELEMINRDDGDWWIYDENSTIRKYLARGQDDRPEGEVSHHAVASVEHGRRSAVQCDLAQAVREEAQAKAAAAASAASAAWEAKHSESARELAKAREEMNELRTRAGRLEAGAATLGNAHSDVQRLTAELDTLRAMSRRDLEEKERTIARLTGDLEMALGGPLTDSQSLRAATSSSTSSASGDVGSAMETTFTFTRRPETPVLAFMALLLIAVIILIVEYGGAAMCALEAMGIYLGAGCGSGSALAASKASAIADATQGDTAERDLGVLAG